MSQSEGRAAAFSDGDRAVLKVLDAMYELQDSGEAEWCSAKNLKGKTSEGKGLEMSEETLEAALTSAEANDFVIHAPGQGFSLTSALYNYMDLLKTSSDANGDKKRRKSKLSKTAKGTKCAGCDRKRDCRCEAGCGCKASCGLCKQDAALRAKAPAHEGQNRQKKKTDKKRLLEEALNEEPKKKVKSGNRQPAKPTDDNFCKS